MLFITPEARVYFKKHINAEKSLHIKLKASGCSGYTTEFTIIKKTIDSINFDGLSVYVLEEDKIKLNDTIIDIRTDGLNQKVVFKNPKAIHHCGCGESFALKKEKETI